MDRDIKLLEKKILVYIENEEYEKASKIKKWLDEIIELKKIKEESK